VLKLSRMIGSATKKAPLKTMRSEQMAGVQIRRSVNSVLVVRSEFGFRLQESFYFFSLLHPCSVFRSVEQNCQKKTLLFFSDNLELVGSIVPWCIPWRGDGWRIPGAVPTHGGTILPLNGTLGMSSFCRLLPNSDLVTLIVPTSPSG